MNRFLDLEAECSDNESDPTYDPEDEDDSIINDGCPYCGFDDCSGCNPEPCEQCGEWSEDCVCSSEMESDDLSPIIDLTGDEEIGETQGLEEAIAKYPGAVSYYQTAPGVYAPVFDVDDLGATQPLPEEPEH